MATTKISMNLFDEGYVVLPIPVYEELKEKAKKLRKVVSAEQPNELLPKEDQAPDQDPEPQQKRRNGKVDHRKINALYDAGWTTDRIADELNISMATVYNHIEKPRWRKSK